MSSLKRVLFLSLISVSIGVKAEAADQQSKSVANADTETKKVTVVCKRYAPTGTRIGKKVCRTQAEWDEMQRKAQTRLDGATKPQSNNRTGN